MWGGSGVTSSTTANGIRFRWGAAEVTAFLTHLAVERHVAASTQNQALSALVFLYREVLQQDFGWLDQVVRAKSPKRLPVVFTPEEAMAVIAERGPAAASPGRVVPAEGGRRGDPETGDPEARWMPYVSPLVCHPSVGRGYGYSHGARIAGTQGCPDHADLHACAEVQWVCGQEPGGAVLVVRAAWPS